MDLLNNALSSDGYTPVNKELAKQIGFVCAGFLGELIRQRKRFGLEEFYFTQSDMEKEIGISAYQQRDSINKLKELGIITTVKKGIPCKTWYIINDEQVINILDNKLGKNCTTGSKENTQLEVKKIEHYSNKNNNKNDNKNKEIIYIDNIKINSLILDFIESRKKIKKPMTDGAIKLFVKQVNEFITKYNEKKTIESIETAIMSGRLKLYEPKTEIQTKPYNKQYIEKQIYDNDSKKHGIASKRARQLTDDPIPL